jgi:hypothetical protein
MVETNTPLLVADKLHSAVVVALPVSLVMLAGGCVDGGGYYRDMDLRGAIYVIAITS